MVRFHPVGHKVNIFLKVRGVPLTGDWFIEDNVISEHHNVCTKREGER